MIGHHALAAAVDRFIPSRATREMRRFILSIGLLSFATAAVGLFEPIFLHELGLGLPGILLYYLGMHATMLPLFPFAVRAAARFGAHHAILVSTPLLIVHYLALYASRSNGSFLVLSLFTLALHNVLYWPNFHMEMAREGQDGERGRELSSLIGVSFLASVFGPVFGGLLIAAAGFSTLFLVASILILVSNVPLLTMPEVRSAAMPGYRKTFRDAADLSGDRKGVAASMLGFGEDLVALVVWPVFVFVTLKGFAATGAVVSAAILISALAIMAIGRLTDTQSKHALLRTGIIFTTAAWLGRLFIRTKLGVLGFDAFYRVARNVVGVPLMSMLYGRAKGSASYEPIVFFEIWLAVGKVLTAGVGIVLLAVFPGRYEPLFILAAVMSLLYARYP